MSTPKAPHETNTNQPAPEKRGLWRKLVFILKALEVRFRFIGILVVIGLIFAYWGTLRNYWEKWTRPAQATVEVADDIEFYCPMHPQVVRDSLAPDGSIPNCPICGMPLSKRHKGAPVELPPGALSRVDMSPEQVRMAGIATTQVNYEPLVRELTTVGYVTYDEEALSEVVSRTGGYIQTLYVNETFKKVEKGEPLAEVYSPKLYSAAQELLVLRDSPRLADLVESTRKKLRLLGIREEEIDKIWKTGKADATLMLRSPQAGFVMNKSVVEGSRIKKGQTLFKLADLSTVWIISEVQEKDLRLIQEGQAVTATLSAFPEKQFTGTVALIQPNLERQTRTVRVRFELDNPQGLLRPGMYATVHLKTPVSELEPFHSQIAARREHPPAADAKAKIAAQGTCPVTELKLGKMGPPHRVTIDGKTVYLCCPDCEDDIKNSPQKYLAEIAPPPINAVLTVPRSAVIDTGTRKVVYVEKSPGIFQGVEVTLGPLVNGQYPVLSGLAPGDKVASAGAFLIDAETRLNPDTASTYYGASGGSQSHRHHHH